MNEQYRKDANIPLCQTYPLDETKPLANVSVFNATIRQIEQAEDTLNRLKKGMDDCLDFIENEILDHCPKCKEDDGVRLTYVKPQVNANTVHGLIVECCSCKLQSAPEYWHETKIESSLSALRHVYNTWGSTTKEGAV